jgi:phosphotriesterase-related protein
MTDAHNHVWISPVAGAAPGAPVLDDEEAIRQELLDYRQAGGGAQIDCQPGGCGRDARRLLRLSQASGVAIVASTGFHLRRYYPPEAALWRMEADQAAQYFLDEIRHGLEETRLEGEVVWPGLIKIAVPERLADAPIAHMQAAARASLESGYAIAMHTERGAGVEDYLGWFTHQGVRPQRLVFCHVDKRPDFGLHAELAQAGVLLEYDTFFRPKYQPEENLWPLIERMASAGWQASLALATDLADGALWARIGGGPGLLGLAVTIRGRLEALGFTPEAVSGMLGGNIARRLAVSENGSL